MFRKGVWQCYKLPHFLLKLPYSTSICNIPRLSPGFKRKDMRLEMTCFCFPYSVVFLRKRAIQAQKSYVAGLIL